MKPLTDKGYQKAFYLLKILHNYYITFLKKNYHSPVRLGFFLLRICSGRAFRDSFATIFALVFFTSVIDSSMLKINSSCLSIQCGNDSKLYGDIGCNAYLNTRCTNNSIGIYTSFIVL